jgi:hypothetical protein
MSADATTPDAEPTPQAKAKAYIPPVLSLRAAPPSPRRLSRKTLIAATLLLGGLIAFALVNGLSDRDRSNIAHDEAQRTQQTASPPENVREAPEQYDLAQLQPRDCDGDDCLWGGHATSEPSSSPSTAERPPSQAAPAPPQAVEADTAATPQSFLVAAITPRREMK